MSTPAVSRTRIALGAAMATATLASAGLAASLAVAESAKHEAAAPVVNETVSTGQGSTTQTTARKHKSDDGENRPAAKTSPTKTTTSGFGQTKPAQTSSQPSQSRTKGS